MATLALDRIDAPLDRRGRAAAHRSDGRVDKFAERRAELADATLQTLAELGYARTSLREIAAKSDFSHGVLHYYFTDKIDLITHCVKRYKSTCVHRYDEVVDSATTVEELQTGFLRLFAATLVEDAPMHRLWYDLRSQSLFEASFRGDVADIDAALEQMIWRILGRAAELSGRKPAVSPAAAYAIFDGLFQQALLRHLSGVDTAAQDLVGAVAEVLPQLLPAAG